MQTTNNRTELNRRFKHIVSLLKQNGEIVKNNREKSLSVFAERLGTKNHIISAYLRDARKITYEQAKLLCQHYQVSEAYLFQGIGDPFEEQTLPAEDKLSAMLGIDFNPNILFTNVEAFASNTVGVDLLEENQHFFIPGMEGDLVAFNINGDSMEPTINAGDMVICTPVENRHDLLEDEIYAVVSNTCVWVKRLKKHFDRYGNWTHVQLISDNSEEYEPFILENSEVRRLLKVTRRITGHF